MRIPTGLHSGSLYRQKRVKTPESSAFRRLLRLVLALVLVIAVMNQAGKPEAYRIFFSEPPKTVVVTPEPPEISSIDFADSEGGDGSTTELEPLDGTIAILSAEERSELIRTMTRSRNQANAATSIAADHELNQTLRDAAQQAGDPFDVDESHNPLADRNTRLRIQAALDLSFLENVNDGSTWKKADNEAFYRLLESGGHIGSNPAKPRRAGVVLMLQQPEVYLHQPIVMTAKVARVAKVNARSNDFGIQQYWELWLHPSDGSERPVAFYSSTVPDEVAKLVEFAYAANGPNIEIEGLYLKRLAFQSQSGSELAPAIVGRIASYEASPSLLPAATSSQSSTPWAALVLLAAIVGIGLAIGIMVASKVSSQRLRNARRIHQPSRASYLHSLAADFEQTPKPERSDNHDA